MEKARRRTRKRPGEGARIHQTRNILLYRQRGGALPGGRWRPASCRASRPTCLTPGRLGRGTQKGSADNALISLSRRCTRTTSSCCSLRLRRSSSPSRPPAVWSLSQRGPSRSRLMAQASRAAARRRCLCRRLWWRTWTTTADPRCSSALRMAGCCCSTPSRIRGCQPRDQLSGASFRCGPLQTAGTAL